MAIPFEIITGPYLNHLTRTATTPTMTPSAHALFPSANLSDNRSSKPAIYGLASSDSTIMFDLNIVPGGSFETTDDTDLWTVQGIGSLVPDGSAAYEGLSGAKLTVDFGASVRGEAIAVRDVIVRSGEELNFFAAAACSSPATTGFGYVKVRNRETGHWLRGSDQVWTSSDESVLAVSSTSWSTVDITFSVESLAICIRDSVRLRIYLDSSGDHGYYDQISMWPSINWLSVHGHNIPPFITPIIEYSTDLAATWTTYQTMTLRRDSFYTLFAQNEIHRHWRLRLEGKPDDAVGSEQMYLGELVAGQSVDMLRNPNYGATLKWADLQTRLESDIGESFVALHNSAPQRTLQMNILFPDVASYEQFHKEVFRGSRGGGNLIAIVPTEMDDSVVILGRVRDSIDVTKNLPLERTSLLEIVEAPLPNAPEVAYAWDEILVEDA